MQRIRGKLRKSILRSTKVQGNWGGTHKYISEAKKSARKVQGNGGETPKIKYTLKAKTSGGKLQGNWGKLKKSILRSTKVQGNCRETLGNSIIYF